MGEHAPSLNARILCARGHFWKFKLNWRQLAENGRAFVQGQGAKQGESLQDLVTALHSLAY